MIKVYKPLKLVHRHDQVNVVEKFLKLETSKNQGNRKDM